MDPFQKLALLEALHLEEILARHFVVRVNSAPEVEFQLRLARVADRFGHEALSCLRDVRGTLIDLS